MMVVALIIFFVRYWWGIALAILILLCLTDKEKKV